MVRGPRIPAEEAGGSQGKAASQAPGNCWGFLKQGMLMTEPDSAARSHCVGS